MYDPSGASTLEQGRAIAIHTAADGSGNIPVQSLENMRWVGNIPMFRVSNGLATWNLVAPIRSDLPVMAASWWD